MLYGATLIKVYIKDLNAMVSVLPYGLVDLAKLSDAVENRNFIEITTSVNTDRDIELLTPNAL